MLTMRGRNSIWWPPTANCGIERLGLEATPTWPAVVLLAGYDPHYSVLQPGSVSRSGLRPPSDHSIIKLWHNYQWHGIRAHQGTHSSRSQWTPALTSHLLTNCSKKWNKIKGRPSHVRMIYCHYVASIVFFWYLWNWSVWWEIDNCLYVCLLLLQVSFFSACYPNLI